MRSVERCGKITNQQQIRVRKKQLFETLETEKLQYIENGLCDQYIRFGLHGIENVVRQIKDREMVEEKRLIRLLREIKKTGTNYDQNIDWYSDYIKKGGDLKKTVSNGSKEWFYLHRTEYPNLLKKYKNEDLAQSKALQQYIKTNGTDQYTEMIRKDDMSVKIYI